MFSIIKIFKKVILASLHNRVLANCNFYWLQVEFIYVPLNLVNTA